MANDLSWTIHATDPAAAAVPRTETNAEAETLSQNRKQNAHDPSSADGGAASSSIDPSLSEVPVICLARAACRYQNRRPAANSGESPPSRMLERQFRSASVRSGRGCQVR